MTQQTDVQRDEGENGLRPGVLGTPGLVATVVATVSPLAAFIGAAPLVFMTQGPGASGIYVMAIVLMLLFAVGYLAMARRVGNASGFILFIAAGLGRTAGVAAAIVTLVTYVLFTASLYGLISTFVQGALADFFGLDVPWGVIAIVALVVISLLSAYRVEFSMRLMAVLLVLAVVALLVFDIAVLLRGVEGGFSFEGFSPAAIFGPGFGLAILFALGTFGGIESTAVYSEEVREPRKTVPRAMYISILGVGLLYLLSAFVVVNAVGSENIIEVAGADPAGFIYALVAEYVGPFWAQLISALLVISLIAGVLGFTNATTRYVFSLGRAGVLPRAIGRTHERLQTPYVAAAFLAAIVLLFTIGFLVAGADPYAQFYTLLFAPALVGVLLLMCVSSLAVVFALNRGAGPKPNLWVRLIAPGIAFLGFAGALVAAVSNFPLIAGGHGFVGLLWVIVPIAAIIGLVMGLSSRFKNLRFDTLEG